MRDLLHTDALIAQARGDTETLNKIIDQSPRTDQGLGKALRDQPWLSAGDLYPTLAPEAAEQLVERQLKVEAGEAVNRSLQELLDVCQRLKQPAATTLGQWQLRVKEFIDITSVSDVCNVSESDARKYRDHTLSKCAGSTTKTRIKTLKAMFTVAVEEGWIEKNPWDAVVLKRIKEVHKKKEAKTLSQVDSVVETGVLKNNNELVYWICRLLVTHVSEAAGMVHGDIDIKNDVVHIRPNNLRPVKNEFRERTLPLTPKLKQKIRQLYQSGKDGEHIDISFYNDKTKRWGSKLQWQRLLNITPKDCRDTVATMLRDAGVNERIIGAILGHVPTTSTGFYGAITQKSIREALLILG